MDTDFSLRDVLEADLPIFFAYQLDPDAQAMAAFTSKDPANREAFLAHWHQILADPTTINRTIVVDGQVAGSVSSYYDDGHPEVTLLAWQAVLGQRSGDPSAQRVSGTRQSDSPDLCTCSQRQYRLAPGAGKMRVQDYRRGQGLRQCTRQGD